MQRPCWKGARVKAFVNEFKEFISRGNVMDMAVGVVVGSAFTSIVNSLVNDIIMPIVGLLTGGIDFSSLKVGFDGAQIAYGNFLNAIINFLIVAFAIFCVVKAMNPFREKSAELIGIQKAEEEAATPVCPFCFEEVKEGATRCPHCGAEIPAAQVPGTEEAPAEA